MFPCTGNVMLRSRAVVDRSHTLKSAETLADDRRSTSTSAPATLSKVYEKTADSALPELAEGTNVHLWSKSRAGIPQMELMPANARRASHSSPASPTRAVCEHLSGCPATPG